MMIVPNKYYVYIVCFLYYKHVIVFKLYSCSVLSYNNMNNLSLFKKQQNTHTQ